MGNTPITTASLTPKRILLVRTDRIGDVVLTTPIFKILKDRIPNVYLACMIKPETKDIVRGNPYLDEIILYDKSKEHRGIVNTFRFASFIRKKKFDGAIVFNPNKRSHGLTFLAGIPIRIGYARKQHLWLTHTLTDRKGEGKHSEAFYNEDLLTFLNIQPVRSRELFFPHHKKADTAIKNFLKQHSIEGSVITINVSSGCPSKMWPHQNFAQLCDLLVRERGQRVVLIGEQSDCKKVEALTTVPLISVDESLSIAQLGSLLKASSLHITNDTGPMHIASAVGTPVISIFGRNHAGLGPERWAPLKGNNQILQKNIGCTPCLAHNCQLEFDCLKATKVEEVFNATQQHL